MVDENFKKIICNRIISLRRKHNLNQEQLAYQSGISKGGLNEIEKYLKIPLIYTIAKICSGLGITMDEFFKFKKISLVSDYKFITMNFAHIMINKDFNKLICNRILTLRKEHNLKLEQLAYQSGISKGGLSEIERNMKEPRAYTILKICSGLGITMKEFFDFQEIDDFTNLL